MSLATAVDVEFNTNQRAWLHIDIYVTELYEPDLDKAHRSRNPYMSEMFIQRTTLLKKKKASHVCCTFEKEYESKPIFLEEGRLPDM